MTTLTRAELYELVWKEPRRTLSKTLGVSDVWIRRLCVAANIPVPTPGYWTKSPALQARLRPGLPLRGLGQDDIVVVKADQRHWGQASAPVAIPPLPEFTETLPELRSRATKQLGKVRAKLDLESPHPHVSALLKEDAERRFSPGAGTLAGKTPRFEQPAGRRRLRLINALLLTLANAGCRSSIDVESLVMTTAVNDTGVRVEIVPITQAKLRESAGTLRPDARRRAPLSIRVVYEPASDIGLKVHWEDTAEVPLEKCLREVASAMLVCAELRYRDRVFENRARLIKWAEHLAEEARKAQQEANRRAAEARARQDQAERDHLVKLARALRDAEDIRELVRSVKAEAGADPEVGQWAERALSVADQIDPRLAALQDLFGRLAMR